MTKGDKPLYEKLRLALRETLDRENWSYLPNERELMQRFQVSRNTLRHAIQLLTDEHVLQPVQGVGTLVYPVPEIGANSRILIVCNYDVMPFQQDVVTRLLFMLNDSDLHSQVLMLDKEHVDVERFDEILKGCDAVILECYCSFSDVILERVRATGKKMVCIRWQPIEQTLSPFVAENVEDGFYQIMRHLFDLGHRHIAYLGNCDDPRRMPGIRHALDEYGISLPPEAFFHVGEGGRKLGYDLAGRLLESGYPFTAVVCHNDSLALGVEERLLIAGLRIPEDVSVTGFDNLSESSEYPVPLTTAAGNLDDIIHDTIAYLFSSRNNSMDFGELLPVTLSIRESTGLAPVSNKTFRCE